MSCQRITRMLSAYQDSELDPGRRQEVERHLRGCAACRSEWNELLELEQRLRLEPVPAVDAFFPGRVMTGLRTEPAGLRRWLQAAAYALVFAAVFLTGFILQTASGSQSVQPDPSRTFSAVLLEPQELGLMAVHDDTLNLFMKEPL